MYIHDYQLHDCCKSMLLAMIVDKAIDLAYKLFYN